MNLNVHLVASKDAFVSLPASVVEQIHNMDSGDQVRACRPSIATHY